MLGVLVMDRMPEIGFLGVRISRKIGLRQVEEGFSSFCAQMFGIFDDFSKFRSASGALHFEKSSNMANIWKIMKKNLVLNCLKPIFQRLDLPKLGFRVPNPPLNS